MNIFAKLFHRDIDEAKRLGQPSRNSTVFDTRRELFREMRPSGFRMPPKEPTHLPKKRSEDEMTVRRVRKPLGRNYCRP